MKAVEDVRYVQHDVRVREVKRNRDDRGEQKAGVLPQRRERTRVEGVVQRLQPPFERLPLFDRQLWVRGFLAE